MAHQASAPQVVDTRTRLRAFENVPIGLLVWHLPDKEDVLSLKLVDFNAAAEHELGIRIGDLIGKRIGVIAPVLLENGVAERYRRVILSGQPETVGELCYAVDGVPKRTFWIECFPLPADRVGVAIEDITERKNTEDARSRDLQLLHRITVTLNSSTDALDAAQVCLTEVCSHIRWPVGRLFLVDADSTKRFLPNSVWHFSDPDRFRGFRQATETYERNLDNKFALEYRVLQGKKAGLTRSVGFSVLEGNWLRAVLEFSSQTGPPLDDAAMRLIAGIGVQLGRVFERERMAAAFAELNERLVRQEQEGRAANRRLHACAGKYLPPLQASLATLRAGKRVPHRTSARELANSLKLVRQYLAEMREISCTPIEFRGSA